MGPLLQVMPWPAYSNMNPRQIRAIYEYLSAIPPVKTPGGIKNGGWRTCSLPALDWKVSANPITKLLLEKPSLRR